MTEYTSMPAPPRDNRRPLRGKTVPARRIHRPRVHRPRAASLRHEQARSVPSAAFTVTPRYHPAAIAMCSFLARLALLAVIRLGGPDGTPEGLALARFLLLSGSARWFRSPQGLCASASCCYLRVRRSSRLAGVLSTT